MLKKCLEQTGPFPMDHPVTQKTTCLNGEIIALDCQPFSIVEDQALSNKPTTTLLPGV